MQLTSDLYQTCYITRQSSGEQKLDSFDESCLEINMTLGDILETKKGSKKYISR
jgi:hypothetical protein